MQLNALNLKSKSDPFTCSEERWNELWVIRNRAGERIAECFNVRDALRITDLLNRQDRREI